MMFSPESIHYLRAAGVQLHGDPADIDELKEIDKLIQRYRGAPDGLIVEWIRARMQAKHAEQSCGQSAEAAQNLEKMLRDLLEGNAALYRLETMRHGSDGARAICRAAGQMREFPVHPGVDPSCLEGIKPWEYVRVRENVVVGTWADDPYLLASAQGDIVSFKGYRDRQQGLVQVSEDARADRVVRLAADLRDDEITPGSKLVLQRDDSSQAIAVIPGQQTHSQFEIPIEQIETRLQDLAGIDSVARQLIEEVVVHVLNPEICKDFGLLAMKGFLLSSYKPGMGKTAFVRGFAYWLYELGLHQGFDVALYFVPPNALKNLYHGEDARIVREDLWGPIRARQAQPRERGLFQFVVFDEVDSLGRRADASEAITSSAQSDALEALLSEMDGLVPTSYANGTPSYTLVAGMTNLPERVDEALKRAGRMGDLVLEMPDIDQQGAEDILAIHARGDAVAWYTGGEIHTDLDEEAVRSQILRPALANIFSTPVLRYSTDSQRRIDVTAGEIFAGVHFKDAMTRAKKRAALRIVQGIGVPAISLEDVGESLCAVAHSAAHQMAADRKMLIRQLRVKVPVAAVDVVPREEFENHRYLHVHSA